MPAGRELVPKASSNCCHLLAHPLPRTLFSRLETNSGLSGPPPSLIFTPGNLARSFFFQHFFSLPGLLISVNIQ